MLDVPGISSSNRLEHEDCDFIECDGAVLDSAGDNDELARAKLDGAVSELEPEAPAGPKK